MLNTKLVQISPIFPAQRRQYHVIIKSRDHASDDYVHVNLCLFGKNPDGTSTAILQRISPYPIPFTKYLPRSHSFEGPDIGDVYNILIAPDSGRIDVSQISLSMDDGPVALFEQNYVHNCLFEPCNVADPERKARYDKEYTDMKEEINVNTVMIATIGTATTGVALGPDKAFAYLLGASIALTYSYMLQNEMDNIGTKKKFMSTGARLGTLTILSMLIVQYFSEQIQTENLYYIVGVLGFMSYKMSIARMIK